MKVCILSRYNLTRNTRVVRQAKALSEAGHEVTVVSLYRPADELVQATPAVEYVEVAVMSWARRRLSAAGRATRRRRRSRGRAFRLAERTRHAAWLLLSLLWHLVVTVPSAFLLRLPGESVTGRIREFVHRPLRPLELSLEALIQLGTTRAFAGETCNALQGRSFDYVQAHDSYALPAAARLAKQSGAELVYDAVEISEHRPRHLEPRTPLDELLFRYERSLEARLIGKASIVLTIGDRLADWHAERYGIPRPISVRNARYFVEHSPDDRIRRDCGLSAQDRLVVLVGNMDSAKGLDAVVEAAAFLPEHVHFAFLGRVFPAHREFVESLWARASELGLDGRIHALGERDPNELIRYVSGADVGVVPLRPVTLNIEYCLPNKVMEMIMARLPVAANRGLVEVSFLVEEYGIGEVFDVESPPDLARAISTLLDPDERPRYQAALTAAAKDLCWENEVVKYLALFGPADGAAPGGEHALRVLAAERETSARRGRELGETRARLRAANERQAALKEQYHERVGALRAAFRQSAARRYELLTQLRAGTLARREELKKSYEQRTEGLKDALEDAASRRQEELESFQARIFELRKALKRQQQIREQAQARALEVEKALEARHELAKERYEERIQGLRAALDDAAERRREDLERFQARSVQLRKALEQQERTIEQAQARALVLKELLDRQNERLAEATEALTEAREAAGAESVRAEPGALGETGWARLSAAGPPRGG